MRCCICGRHPTHEHHVLRGTYRSASPTISLCPDHHAWIHQQDAEVAISYGLWLLKFWTPHKYDEEELVSIRGWRGLPEPTKPPGFAFPEMEFEE